MLQAMSVSETLQTDSISSYEIFLEEKKVVEVEVFFYSLSDGNTCSLKYSHNDNFRIKSS